MTLTCVITAYYRYQNKGKKIRLAKASAGFLNYCSNTNLCRNGNYSQKGNYGQNVYVLMPGTSRNSASPYTKRAFFPAGSTISQRVRPSFFS